MYIYTPAPRRRRGVYCFTSVHLSVLPSFHPSILPSFRPSKIFFVAFFSVTVDGRNLIFGHNASYRYTILWVAFLDPSHSYFLFADLVGFYIHIFRHIFLSNYWWQKSDIWSQASYRYPISWEALFDPSDSYFLFVEKRGYHTCKWALAHSSSCLAWTICVRSSADKISYIRHIFWFKYATIMIISYCFK